MSDTWSISLALADAAVAWIIFMQANQPIAFPAGLTFTPSREYLPVSDLTKLQASNPYNQPLVQIFPGTFDATISGVDATTVNSIGEYELHFVVLAFVGPPGAGFKAKLDPLANLMQSLQEIFKGAGTIEAGGSVTGKTKLSSIRAATAYLYDPTILKEKQCFVMEHIFSFEVAPVV